MVSLLLHNILINCFSRAPKTNLINISRLQSGSVGYDNMRGGGASKLGVPLEGSL